MARLYLFAEGVTEQAFADTVLKPHLATFEVYLHPPVLIAHARKKGRVHRGGGRKYVPMKNDIMRFLSQEKSSDVFFTTMIDLYAIPTSFQDSLKPNHCVTIQANGLRLWRKHLPPMLATGDSYHISNYMNLRLTCFPILPGSSSSTTTAKSRLPHFRSLPTRTIRLS